MHQLLPLKLKIAIVAISTLAVSLGAEWTDLRPLGIGVTIAVVELAVLLLMSQTWGLRIWRWIPGLPRWLKEDLSGEWTGTIISEWRPDGATLPPGPIPVVVRVKQSWSDVVLAMQTGQMQSRTFGAWPVYDPALQVLHIHYFYKTEPTAAAAAENPPQRLGCGVARVELEKPNKINITYANERGAGGEIQLERKKRR